MPQKGSKNEEELKSDKRRKKKPKSMGSANRAKGGRKLLPPDEIRSYRVTDIRFNRKEIRLLEKLKEKSGLSTADIFRTLLLKQPIRVPVPKLFPQEVLEVLRDLRRSTGLLQVMAWKEKEITSEEKSYLFDAEIGLVRTIEQTEIYVTQGLRKADNIQNLEALVRTGESLIIGLSQVAIQEGKLGKKESAELDELKRIFQEMISETQVIGNYNKIEPEL
ncbi:hypothetical protein [Siphonobacter sp. SORGH_AS_1065]|uniref:hypothetical protein n=1 Tax=Siphonobacter sp. SORGH_AS_1065 TaxID=3041795 RepID=UPI0027826D22|nr:hypothetical protein [Siphonobacter sp. SORGH_AS_1065]MDQ1090456.1 hypothetical protein [Siphonobacter sp. SORGH_AS_1065]